MRISRKQFEQMLKHAQTLTGVARKNMMALLDGATIVDTDDKGVETETIAKIHDDGADDDSADEVPAIDEVVAKAKQKAEETIVAKSKPKSEAVRPFTQIEVKDAFDAINIPSKVYRPTLKSFVGEVDGMKADQRAYAFGKWFLSFAGKGNPAHAKWCEEHGIKTHLEGTDSAGGYTVPEQFVGDLINLVNQYGVLRQNARVVPMTSDTLRQPRVTGRLTAYWVGENVAGTTSDATFDQISLVAKKLMVLTSMSSELNEDSAISLAEFVASDIARALAYEEDRAGFLGTGLSTDGGIVGVSTSLGTINGTDDGGGLVLAAGNLFSEFTLANLNATVARVPSYARPGAKWYCSPTVFDSVIARLALAAGGALPIDIINGVSTPKALGYPVVLTEVLPSTDVNSQIALLFGNLAQSTTFGDRRSITISTDSSLYFTQDALAVKGTERIDINSADLGTSTVAGPVVGLISASS